MNPRPSAPARFFPTLLALLAVLAVFASGAQAGPVDPIEPEQFPEYRAALVGADDGQRDYVLAKLLEQPRASHPQLYGELLGPVFRDAATWEAIQPDAERRRRQLRLIKHLVQDRPADGEDEAVLLGPDFIGHLAADPKLLSSLRAALLTDPRTGQSVPWDRLMKEVLNQFGHPESARRVEALRLAALSASDHADRIQVPTVVAHVFLAEKAKGATWTAADHAAVLDAMDLLLNRRFADMKAVVAFLAPFGERLRKVDEWDPAAREAMRADLFQAVTRLDKADRANDRQQDRDAAVRFGKALIAKAAGPGDLLLFFDAEEKSYVDLQVLALRRAADLKPEATKEWGVLLERALDGSDDGAVLDLASTMLAGTYPTYDLENGAHTVAEAVARRLRDPAKADSVKRRTTLAVILSRIGRLLIVEKALPTRLETVDAAEQPVYAELIRALGGVSDGKVRPLVARLRAGSAEVPPWVRQAIADALGGQGISKNEEERPRAARLLVYMLTGAETQLDADTLLPGTTGETDAGVREAAIGSLEPYPGPEVAKVLRDIATEETAAGAAALKTLRRQLQRGSKDAGVQIAGLIDALPAEERLGPLLEVVAKATPEDLDPAARSARAAGARQGFGMESPAPPLLEKATRVATKLRDVEALPAVFELWKPAADKPDVVEAWQRPLQELVVAVAKTPDAPAALDVKLAEFLQAYGDQGKHAEALRLYAVMGTKTADRFELKRGRADMHFVYASVTAGRDVATRRADLDAALKHYDELINMRPAAEKDLYRTLFNILDQRASDEMLDSGEDPKGFLFRALEAAVKTGGKAIAETALGMATRLGALALDDQEKQALANLRGALQAITGN